MPLNMSRGAKLLLFGVRHRRTLRSRDMMARRASVRKGLIPVPGQKIDPDVLMMEPAEDWYCCDASGLLRTPKIRCILGQ
jgi:hypothetical protein